MALIMPDANVAGTVHFGSLCCVQSQCSVVSLMSEISLGSANVIEEQCSILCSGEKPFMIGDNNYFEAKSSLIDCQISNGCLIGSGAILKNVTLFGGNVIAPKIELKDRMLDLNECAFFDRNGQVVIAIVDGSMESRLKSHAQLVEALVAILKNGKLKK